jgi:hypothetical protein
MKNFLFQNKLLLTGIVLGAVAGFLYWKIIVVLALSLQNGLTVQLMVL